MFDGLWSVLADTQAGAWIAAALGTGVAWLARQAFVRRWRLERALQCLEAGVRQTYEEYVRGVKEASDDGKLSPEQRETATRRALAAARDYARREGIDLLRHYAEAYLPVAVDRIVRRFRSESRLARVVPSPFGDSSPGEASDAS